MVLSILYNKDFRKFFVPRVIAIGTLHHDSKGLKQADDAKLKLASSLIKAQGVREKMLYMRRSKRDSRFEEVLRGRGCRQI
ncbi:hypothetical protein CRYUN_Cryun05aG0105300 [Craigia yunnanensis]